MTYGLISGCFTDNIPQYVCVCCLSLNTKGPGPAPATAQPSVRTQSTGGAPAGQPDFLVPQPHVRDLPLTCANMSTGEEGRETEKETESETESEK